MRTSWKSGSSLKIERGKAKEMNAIETDEVQKLRQIAKILFREDRLDGDAQRDMAQTLASVIKTAEAFPFSEKELQVLELQTALKALLLFVTSGRRYKSQNPYTLPEVNEALKALQLTANEWPACS